MFLCFSNSNLQLLQGHQTKHMSGFSVGRRHLDDSHSSGTTHVVFQSTVEVSFPLLADCIEELNQLNLQYTKKPCMMSYCLLYLEVLKTLSHCIIRLSLL